MLSDSSNVATQMQNALQVKKLTTINESTIEIEITSRHNYFSNNSQQFELSLNITIQCNLVPKFKIHHISIKNSAPHEFATTQIMSQNNNSITICFHNSSLNTSQVNSTIPDQTYSNNVHQFKNQLTSTKFLTIQELQINYPTPHLFNIMNQFTI